MPSSIPQDLTIATYGLQSDLFAMIWAYLPIHVQMCYLDFNLDAHLHTTTRVVGIVVVALFQQ